MKEDSATNLLNTIMDWKTPEHGTEEIPDLLALSSFGYDDYQQFRPGMRFIESLALWLYRFPENKREHAYQFVKNELLFITRQQMEQTVSIAYRDYVIPSLLKQISEEKNTHRWEIVKLTNLPEFEILHAQSLFTGLSDGSHIDIFRRSNMNINHEQVSRTHEINSTRANKIKEALKERLEPFSAKNPNHYFRNVFLLDDFSASGISYLKEDVSSPNGVKGKIGIFYNSIVNTNDPFHSLVNCDDLRVYLILYIATETAISYLQNLGSKIFKSIPFTVIPIHILPDNIKFDPNKNKEFFELVKKKEFGWENLGNIHYSQGPLTNLFLGFNEGGLPLVIYHNTPNNSLPILHRNDDRTNFKGLFPRVSRHQ